jgi:hypothetical protein
MASNNLTLLCARALRMRNIALQTSDLPPRLELVNIYATTPYTQAQLDMRRKAEILKYAPTRMSTQTNNLTKKQYFALAANGRSIPVTAQKTCPPPPNRPQPTSASDVPGPIIYLYEDSAVPIYNLVTNNRAYPQQNLQTNVDILWQTQYELNVQQSSNSNSKSTLSLLIKNTIDQPFYNYEFQTTIGICVQGQFKSATSLSSVVPFSVVLVRLYCQIFFVDSLVQTISIDVSQFSGLTFDLSGSTPSSPFSACQFVGIVDIPNIRLFTEPTYYYTFRLRPILSITGGDNTAVSYLESFLVSNLSANMPLLVPTNCHVSAPGSTFPSSTTGIPMLSGL